MLYYINLILSIRKNIPDKITAKSSKKQGKKDLIIKSYKKTA